MSETQSVNKDNNSLIDIRVTGRIVKAIGVYLGTVLVGKVVGTVLDFALGSSEVEIINNIFKIT